MKENPTISHPDPLHRLVPEFLEDVLGDEALHWATQMSAEAEGSLRNDSLEEDLLKILDDPRRIPQASFRGGYAYNFWTDRDHPRGLWRRQPQDRYLAGEGSWETLIDIDKLAREEGKSWVWHGAAIRYPEADRALVTLSDGGTDADETREFDLGSATWVADGFFRPAGKGSLSWVDLDHCWLTQPLGEGTVSAAGYPLQARLLSRGQELSAAPVIQAGSDTDMGVWAGTLYDELGVRSAVTVMEDFYSSATYIGSGDPAQIGPDSLARIPVPATAEVSVWNEWTLTWLREDWELPGHLWPAGSLVAFSTQELLDLGTGAQGQSVFTPADGRVIEGMTVVRDHLVLTILDNVVPRIAVATPSDQDAWDVQEVPLPPELVETDPFVTIAVRAVESPASADVWAVTTGYKTPSTLWMLRWTGDRYTWQPVRQAPKLYDAEGIAVTQHFAISEDGTAIPYFQVSPDVPAPAPTLLYGYGGFNVSLLPAYSAGVGRAWLERGGTYVVANIRGGGEYGPTWHTAALRENRHLAYQDFVAVARDLVTRGVTTPGQLGAQGGSNGGLLVGNMYTQFPQDFGAIVCQVPLLDMGRFHTLLAGHSWVAEYGNPEEPSDWEFIQSFSPVHLFDAAVDYPPLLLTTSTRDDRVHPGHARSLAHLAREAGKDVLYYENTEGGHAGAADNSQRAHAQALAWQFLWEKLSPQSQ